MTAGQLYDTEKVSLPEKLKLIYANLEFPFITGFPSHKWNKTHLLTMTAGPSILLWKVVLNYATQGLPFIMGFPSHEWNETHPLTMTAGQPY